MAFLANVIATIEQSELASIEMTMARKFSIDMLPNPKPMPRALHQRAPFEFREFRDQLKELRMHEFFSTYILPSNVPVLFI